LEVDVAQLAGLLLAGVGTLLVVFNGPLSRRLTDERRPRPRSAAPSLACRAVRATALTLGCALEMGGLLAVAIWS